MRDESLLEYDAPRPKLPPLRPCVVLEGVAAPAPTAEWLSQPFTRWQLGYFQTCLGLRDYYGREPL